MYLISRPSLTFLDILKLFNVFRYSKKRISEFEEAFAASVGRRYACTFSGARIAIQKVLESGKIHNQTVAMPAYTCIVVPFAVELSGNKPLFVEAQSNHFVPAAEELSKKAPIIISTHIFGVIEDPSTYVKPSLYIEDACLAYGSMYNGKRAGTFGDISVFSFNQSKQLSCYGGGIAVTDDATLYAGLRPFAEYSGTVWQELKQVITVVAKWFAYRKPVYSLLKYLSFFNGISTDFSLDDSTLDASYNKSFLISQAILGLLQVERSEQILAARRKIAAWYNEALSGYSDIVIPTISPDIQLSHYWVILGKDRSLVQSKLRDAGVNTGYANEYTCPLTPRYRADHSSDEFAWSEKIGHNIINLPFYVGLTKKDIYRIAERFKKVYGEV